jgi:hypothetical protein
MVQISDGRFGVESFFNGLSISIEEFHTREEAEEDIVELTAWNARHRLPEVAAAWTYSIIEGSPQDMSHRTRCSNCGSLCAAEDVGDVCCSECCMDNEPDVCEWFALCDYPAAGKVWHPVLGLVPTCKRCAGKCDLDFVCWNCDSAALVTEPDPGMQNTTDRVRCLSCNEIQITD